MKVLRLSNSLDNDTHVAPEERTPVILRRRLEEELGFPVELENRNLWPSPGLPAAIERWLSTTDAEVVQFIINPFWYCYASVPMRMEKTPIVGRRLVDWGQRLARKRGISETAPFRAARRWAQGTVGAATFFEPDEVITLVDQCVRVIARHEDLVAAVFGPPTSGLHNETQRGLEWSERRRQRVFAQARELCGRLHIAYDLPHEPAVPELWPSFRAGDFSHMNKLGHEYAAEWQVPSLVAACREAASVTVG